VTTSHPVIVVGAGISGLACAYALKKSGHDVLVMESSKTPGGMIHSISEDGFLFETGPQSFNKTGAISTLIEELGIANELITAPPGAPRYLLTRDTLRAVPLSPPAFLASSLFNLRTKFALLSEPFRTTHPPNADESIAAFTRRKFTQELLDLLVAPFVTGIYAGDPEQLSLRAAFPQIHEAEKAAGSIIRGMKQAAKSAAKPKQRPTVSTFQEGNETLVRALATSLDSSLLCGVTVSQIKRTVSRGFSLHVESSLGTSHFDCKSLVLATPAKISAELLETESPATSQLLAEVPYAPVAVVSLGYRRTDVTNPLNGFGFLVHKSPKRRILGSVWNSSLFPARCPQDHVLLTNFFGGALDPEGASEFQLAGGQAHDQLMTILGINADPVALKSTFYRHAIPQCNLGHLDRLAAIQAESAKIPGLYLTGNYIKGPAIGTCVEHAQSVADSIRIG
jgi:oxygen-dependent protoporphyrinogen oxidase